jgi:protein-disulfide isomerase
MMRTQALSALTVLTLMFSTPLAAQSQKQQNDAILNELRAIRQLLEKLAAPAGPPAPVPTSDNVTLTNLTGYIIGKPDAPLTMVEFTDLQCPFCRVYHVTTFEQLKRDYIDTGKLRYISRDFPLEAIHPLANAAARAARCAGDQGKFWEMRHIILANNQTIGKDVFATFAQDLKLNANEFLRCTSDANKYQDELKKDQAEGVAAGINGTPSFIIGRTSGASLDGIRIVGAQPYAAFDAKLKELLATKP